MQGYLNNDTMTDIISEIIKAVENNTLTEAHIQCLERVISHIDKDIDMLEKVVTEQPTKRRKALIARCSSKYIAVHSRLESALNELTADSRAEHITHIKICLNDAYKMIEERL